MKRILLRAGVGVVAIAAAIVLFPRPDTGGDVAPQPVPVEAEPLSVVQPAVAEEPKPVVALRAAKKEARSRVQDRQDAPESKAAAELTAPIGGLRYTLRGMEEPYAVELAAALAGPHKDLNALRRAPDAKGLDDALGRLDGALEDVRESKFASDPNVEAALQRYDALRADL